MIRRFRRQAVPIALTLCLCGTMQAIAQRSDPILDRIKANGAIAIGYREAASPFSALDDQHNPAGYSIDLCAARSEADRMLIQGHTQEATQRATAAPRRG